MEKLVLYINGNKIQVQRADYIEDGWYVVVNGDKIQLYEIPLGGGEAIFIGEHKTLLEAIRKGEALT
jgi:hypothetical protein